MFLLITTFIVLVLLQVVTSEACEMTSSPKVYVYETSIKRTLTKLSSYRQIIAEKSRKILNLQKAKNRLLKRNKSLKNKIIQLLIKNKSQ